MLLVISESLGNWDTADDRILTRLNRLTDFHSYSSRLGKREDAKSLPPPSLWKCLKPTVVPVPF